MSSHAKALTPPKGRAGTRANAFHNERHLPFGSVLLRMANKIPFEKPKPKHVGRGRKVRYSDALIKEIRTRYEKECWPLKRIIKHYGIQYAVALKIVNYESRRVGDVFPT